MPTSKRQKGTTHKVAPKPHSPPAAPDVAKKGRKPPRIREDIPWSPSKVVRRKLAPLAHSTIDLTFSKETSSPSSSNQASAAASMLLSLVTVPCSVAAVASTKREAICCFYTQGRDPWIAFWILYVWGTSNWRYPMPSHGCFGEIECDTRINKGENDASVVDYGAMVQSIPDRGHNEKWHHHECNQDKACPWWTIAILSCMVCSSKEGTPQEAWAQKVNNGSHRGIRWEKVQKDQSNVLFYLWKIQPQHKGLL